MAVIPNVVPWGLHPLQPWIETELSKRSSEINMNSDRQSYSGPRTAWIRFFSNGISPTDSVEIDAENGGLANSQTRRSALESNHEGFILGGTHGFNDSYGFNDSGRIVIGYDAHGEAHTINPNMGSSLPHRPPPSIESIEVSLYGGQNASYSGLCRKARVHWKCFSLDQLNYMAPYFLTPKVTATLEWGWNNYNPASLLDLTKPEELVKILVDGEGILNRIQLSNGNYDAMIGFIFDYEFKMNSLGGYDCYTEFVNTNWLLEGQEYKNRTIVKIDDSGSETEIKLKDIVQFIDSDINNLELKRTDVDITLRRFDTTGKIFPPKNHKDEDGKQYGQWIRMDLFVEIINNFFSVELKSRTSRTVGKGIILDIKDSVICGHPALKSTNEDVLVPNRYAPKFTTEESEKLRRKSDDYQLGDRSIPNGTDSPSYLELYGKTGIGSVLSNGKITKEYDDLCELINYGFRSFPVYERGTTENTKYSSPGTWGYLSDLFISTKMLKEVILNGDTSHRAINVILERINSALCGVVQLKMVPHQDSAKYTIIDTNYTPRSTPSSATDLARFSPGSINSAYMTNVGFSVKLSQVMANQMVAQSSANQTITGVNVRTGTQKANRFVGNDRLYDYGTIAEQSPANVSTANKKNVSDRKNTDNGQFLMKYRYNKRENIIVDKDVEFMKSVISSDSSGKIIYINSPIMPGTKFEMETLGIGGFTFLGMFTLDHVPKMYRYDNCVWQIGDIKQKITNGTWTTGITADCRPLSYIETR
jgi:hypothetical protein